MKAYSGVLSVNLKVIRTLVSKIVTDEFREIFEKDINSPWSISFPFSESKQTILVTFLDWI